MTAPRPIPLLWDGESFTPANQYWARVADKHFVLGETYPMEVREDRSPGSHRQYFASIHNVWMNLPEKCSDRLPTPEHLRKYALIKCGFRDERSIVCSSEAEAGRVAAFIRPMDDFALVVTLENMVTVFTAKSQSLRAMRKDEFEASKRAVLDYVASMIGTDISTLETNTDVAA